MYPPEEIALTGDIGPVATMKDGRIFSCYAGEYEEIERLDLDEERPEIWVYVRTSDDGGRTWTEPQQAFAFPAGKGTSGGGPLLVDRDGNIHIFSMRIYKIDWEGLEVPELDNVMQHNVSKDDGKTWSPVKEIDFGHRYTGSFNCVIQMDNGRILVPLAYYDWQRKTGKFVSMTVYSDDGGETWGKSNDCPVDSGGEWIESGACEPVIVQFPSGMVWMIIRTQTGYNWECFSNDGATWTPPRSTRIVSSNSPSAVLRLADDRIVLFWNNLYGEPFTTRASSQVSYARHTLHGAISDDEGQTWSPPKVVAQRRQGEPPNTSVTYPFVCQALDGAVVLSYLHHASWEPADIFHRIIRVDPDWLATR